MLEITAAIFDSGPNAVPHRVADWMEANILSGAADDDRISQPSVKDAICAAKPGLSQDDAAAIADAAINFIRTRERLVGRMYPVSLDGTTLVSATDCLDPSAYSLCLGLSLSEVDSAWGNSNISNATRMMFEELTVEALKAIFPTWVVSGTGWTAGASKGAIVEKVATAVHERVNRSTLFAAANDGQVDVICHKGFADRRGGYPVYLIQSATGRTNWDGEKLHEPNLALWEDAVAFRNKPRRGLAIPFSLDETIFDWATTASSGLILDRVRIVGSLHGPLSVDLSNRISNWFGAAMSNFSRV